MNIYNKNSSYYILIQSFNFTIMKKTTIFSLIILMGSYIFLSCTEKVSTISGITNKNEKVLFSNVNLDICHEAFLDTIISNDKGEFQLKLNIKQERFIILKLTETGHKYILPIVPGENYQIFIDNNGKLKIKGLYEEGINLYQSVLQYDPYSFNWEVFSNQSSEKRSKTIENIKKTELDSFKILLTEAKISKKFYQLIESDRDCFYAMVETWLYSWDYIAICRNPVRANNDDHKKSEITKSAAEVFSRYSPDNHKIMKSPNWDMYAQFMYIKIFQQYFSNKINKNNVEQLLFESNIPFWFDRIKTLFKDKSLEAMLAVFIYSNGGPEGYNESKESIPVYEFFKTNFPESSYLKYFQHMMERTISFYDGNKTDSAINIIQTTDSIETFEALISKFKGKKIYVDVWATWCAPCRAEFKHKDKLGKILNEYDVIPLYISLDEIKQEEKWEAIVYTHNLKGYHFRANKPFIDDLNRIYQTYINSNSVGESGKKSFSIPWYILIDENGNIINDDAPRPSNMNEIQELLIKLSK